MAFYFAASSNVVLSALSVAAASYLSVYAVTLVLPLQILSQKVNAIQNKVRLFLCSLSQLFIVLESSK